MRPLQYMYKYAIIEPCTFPPKHISPRRHMRYIGLRAILVAVLVIPFTGPGIAIIYHLVVDGSLAKQQPNLTMTATSVDAY